MTVPVGQPLAGTYRTQYSYSTTGLMTAETPAAGGGLPAESLTFTYDKLGDPITENGLDTYASNAVWTPFGEISQIDLGTGPSSAALTYSYDPQTRNVTGINLSDQQPVPQVDNVAYTYNADQQITQIADTQGAAGVTGRGPVLQLRLAGPPEPGLYLDQRLRHEPRYGRQRHRERPRAVLAVLDLRPRRRHPTATNHATAGSTSGDTTTTYHYAAPGHAHAVSSTTATNTVTGSGAHHELRLRRRGRHHLPGQPDADVGPERQARHRWHRDRPVQLRLHR